MHRNARDRTNPAGRSTPNRPIVAPGLRSNTTPTQPTPRSMINPRLIGPPPLPRTPQGFASNQHPNVTSRQQLPPRPVMAQPTPWANEPEVKFYVKNLPPGYGTLDIFRLLKALGTLIRIDIEEPRRNDRTNAWVVFSPPPRDVALVRIGIDICGSGEGVTRHIQFERAPAREGYQQSPVDPRRKFAEQIKVAADEIAFGVMKTQTSMLDLYGLKSTPAAPLQLVMDLKRRCLDVDFTVSMGQLSRSNFSDSKRFRQFKMRLNFTQMSKVCRMRHPGTGQMALLISLDMPPLLFRKTNDVEGTHEPGSTLWTEWQTWYRQTGIDHDSETTRMAPTQLQKEHTIIDIGRWLTYRLVFSAATSASPSFTEVCEALNHHNVPVDTDRTITSDRTQKDSLWNWLDNPTIALRQMPDSLIPSSELHEMADEIIHMPFEVRYQLEACISRGLLHECNITKEFLRKLVIEPDLLEKDVDQARAQVLRLKKLLEKVCDTKERFWNPNDIFPRLLREVSIATKKPPSYCALVRAATVTPTTIYFETPVLETSNSILRRYSAYMDRFLRVKFTDEKYKGKIQSSEDDSTLEVFTRVKRTMTNGINVGGRHYEFLAFGSSQFREGGAYFFSSGGGLTAEIIREAMGNFSDIKVVAKYCARVGQSFSTTRTTRNAVTIERISDIERNGYCFTDGVGKMSPLMAQLVAQEYGLPCSATDYPSVFQFRLGGCKGVLAVDPSLTGRTVQIRPSQEKFTTMEARPTLDIVRISQFSTAYLNVQLILVLSALGIEDRVFLDKMMRMLSDLEEAMRSERKALELLQKSVDFNQMTLQLASMLVDGFMETRDPFTISCLRLWRSWSTKYLKEKARIYVEQGAFVFGCIDESGTLKGHFDGQPEGNLGRKDVASLPEVFIQITDPSCKGKLKVIKGICIIARNPSLHPGDVRVVHAVDVPHLHSHRKDCLVLPQTGDRDLANMCSGGDLDGDDYLVIWDKDLIPTEWNHAAMNYDPPTPKTSNGPVTVDDMTSFFVTHLKHSNVSRIAVAHRYHADGEPEGVKSEKCLELAQLHSMAVDYVKTGVPAHMPKRLRVSRWPHWSEPKNKSKKKVYKSRKVLGRLYDLVTCVDFLPAWELPFDKRVLEAYNLDVETLECARGVKQEYDESVRRIMAKFSIKSEFEIWTTFVMAHCDDINDYKFAETIGEAVNSMKDYHQKLCFEKAGTTDKERDWSKIGPFIAAMYTVTAQEMAYAVAECKGVKLIRGQWVPAKITTFDNMPFMSFPWLFPTELGRIANKQSAARDYLAQPFTATRKLHVKKPNFDLGTEADMLEPLTVAKIPEGGLPDANLTEDNASIAIARTIEMKEAPQPHAVHSEQAKTDNVATAERERSATPHSMQSDGARSEIGTNNTDDLNEFISKHPSSTTSLDSTNNMAGLVGVEEEYDVEQGEEQVICTVGRSPWDDLDKLMAS